MFQKPSAADLRRAAEQLGMKPSEYRQGGAGTVIRRLPVQAGGAQIDVCKWRQGVAP